MAASLKNLEIISLFDAPEEHTIAASLLNECTYPWEVLPQLSKYILELGKTLSPLEYERRGEDIWIAKGAKIAPSASISGPTIICDGAEIRQCAYIRGSAIVGRGCVVGNSVELKNCLLFDKVQVPHFNYVGDSILGYRSHMGAGAVTSNVKSDKTPVTVKLPDEKVATGLKKMGAILGDFVEVGCNTVLNPGTIIGKCTNVYPLSSVRGYIPGGHIYKTGGVTVKKNDTK